MAPLSVIDRQHHINRSRSRSHCAERKPDGDGGVANYFKSSQVKSSQVANPRNAFRIEQRTAAKSKEAQVRVFGLFLLLPRFAPVGLIAR